LLRLAVDSLYLSFPGKLAGAVERQLKKAKQEAQSPEYFEQANATFYADGHLLHVSARGASYFPYILQDARFRIQVASSKVKKLPLAYVQVSSDFLTHVGVQEAVRQLEAIINELGDREGPAKVARIDLCADFQTDVHMESWSREAWVTRAASINSYSVDGKFSGWAIGLGGVIAGRLYDKSLEIETSGKTYLRDLWTMAIYEPEQPVFRLEFEIKREILKQYGLNDLPSVLNVLDALWLYATEKWLRLAVPDPEDSNRARWPTHWLWQQLMGVDWRTPPFTLKARFVSSNIPSEDFVCNSGFNAVLGFMLREGIQDFDEGEEAFSRRMRSYHWRRADKEGAPFWRYVTDRLMLKARQYKMVMEAPEPDWEKLEAERIDKAGELYRKASDGE
jgi:hypothetical protein